MDRRTPPKDREIGSTTLDDNRLYEPGGSGAGTGGGRYEYKKIFQREQKMTIVDDIIGVVPNVIQPEQCEHVIGLCSQYYFPKQAEIYKGGGDPDINYDEPQERQGELYWISYLDEPWIMDNFVRPWVYEYNKEITKFDMDWWADHDGQLLNYKDEGDWFQWHRDGLLDTYEHLGALQGEYKVRKISISLQLSQYGTDYEGAELLVGENRPLKDDPMLQQGSLIIFPSWMQHKVTKLTKGNRWSWTYWFTGPPWR